MPNWKEVRFRIDGEIDGVEITPYTSPMARLALYIADLAQLLGHRESVHLISVAEGSTQPVIYVDAEEESRVMHRVRNTMDWLTWDGEILRNMDDDAAEPETHVRQCRVSPAGRNPDHIGLSGHAYRERRLEPFAPQVSEVLLS